MDANVRRAGKILGGFLALWAVFYVAMEWWVTKTGEILVVDKTEFRSQSIVLRQVTADGGQSYGTGIETIGSEEPVALWEKLKPGCRYRIRYIDQSRYVYARKKGLNGLSVANAEQIDCPGVPKEPEPKALSGEELLDRLTRPQLGADR